MRRVVLLAAVCLLTAVMVVPLATGPAAPVQKARQLALERDPILGTANLTGTEGLNGWYISPVTVSIVQNGSVNYTLNYTMSNATWLPYTGPFVITTNGTTYVEFRGYINSTANESVKVDVKIDMVKPFTEARFRDPFLQFVAKDNESGIDRTMYKVDDGNWTLWNIPRYMPSVGQHLIQFYSIDRAGHTEDTKNISIRASRDPILGYSINGTLGLNNWYKSAATITVKKNGSVNYTLDNVTWQLYTKPIVITFNGTTHVELRGFINVTLNETIKLDINIDCVKPESTSSFFDPVFSMSGFDNVSGVSKTMFRVDGGDWWLYLKPYKPLIGTHQIEYYTIDMAGNAEPVKNITVVVAPHTRMAELGMVIAVLGIGLGAFFYAVMRKPSPRVDKAPEEKPEREDWK